MTGLIRTNPLSMTTTSLKDLAREAESVMLLIDASGSMETHIKSGERRIDALRKAVEQIKAVGSIPMVAFGGPFDAQVMFVDDVPEPGGGTPMHLAIPFAKSYGATRLVIVSDGMPDLMAQTFDEARAFGGKIDVVFIGDKGEAGGKMLKKLAEATGGTLLAGDLADTLLLSSGIIGLLEGPKETKTVFEGAGFSTVDPEAVEEAEEDEDDDDEEDEL